MADRPSRFVPVVGLGLVSGAAAAVAGAKPWFSAVVAYKLMPGVREPDTSIDLPLALAVGLVVLAGWGAVLVTRGRVRRALMVLTAAAALAFVACLVVGPLTLPDDLRGQLAPGSAGVLVTPTGWYVVAALAGVVSLLATVVGVRLVPRWPEMAQRYDAPGAQRTPDEIDPDDQRAVWKALDEGRDPTEPGAP